MSSLSRTRRLAQCALLLSPLLLTACYVVPIAPAPYPAYEPHHPKPYPDRRHQHRGYRYGEAPAAAGSALAEHTTSGSMVAFTAPSFESVGTATQIAASDLAR